MSLQEYALERLKEGVTPYGGSGEVAIRDVEHRHGKWYARCGTAETIESLDFNGGAERQRLLDPELKNLMGACRRAVASTNPGIAVPTFIAACKVLERHGPVVISVALGKEVLQILDHSDQQAHVLTALGKAENLSGAVDDALIHYNTALAIYQNSGDRRHQGEVIGNLGAIHREQGRMDDARAC